MEEEDIIMGQEKVMKLETSVRKLCLDYRALFNITMSPAFCDEFNRQMTEQEQDEISKIILSGKRKEAKSWLKEYRMRVWGNMSFNDIREIAKGRGIANYSRLTKVELLRSIYEQV